MVEKRTEGKGKRRGENRIFGELKRNNRSEEDGNDRTGKRRTEGKVRRILERKQESIV
jgi:hypothetical protein